MNKLLKATVVGAGLCAAAWTTSAHAYCAPGPNYSNCEEQEQRQEQMRQQQEAERQEQMRQQQEAERQEQMRQQQEAQRQEQMRQQEAERQEQMRQQQEAQRQEQMRQQQEAERQEQFRQQQETQRQEQFRQQQETQRQEQFRQQQQTQRQEQFRQQQQQQQSQQNQQRQNRSAQSFGAAGRQYVAPAPAERHFGSSAPVNPPAGQAERHFGVAPSAERRAGAQASAPQSEARRFGAAAPAAAPERHFGEPIPREQAHNQLRQTAKVASPVVPTAPVGNRGAPHMMNQIKQTALTQRPPPRPRPTGFPRQPAPTSPPGGNAGPPARQSPPIETVGRLPPRGRPITTASAGQFFYRGAAHPRAPARPYRWPTGVSHRTYAVGQQLPRVFMRYVIANWADYGVAPPPDGDEWVRYGDDMLAVDPSTGDIADSAGDVFNDAASQFDASAGPGDTGDQGYAQDPGYAQDQGNAEDQGNAGEQGSPPSDIGSADAAEAVANDGLDALSRGESQVAADELTRAIDSRRLSGKEQAMAYLRRGQAYMALHQGERARTDLAMASRLNPDDPEAAGLLRELSPPGGGFMTYAPWILSALFGGALLMLAGLAAFGGLRRRAA